MNLQQFVEQTVADIVRATSSLQRDLAETGAIVNPPVSGSDGLSEESSPGHVQRRVELAEFDVAVAATSESGADGKVGLKVLSAELGVGGRRNRADREISRVKFTLPVVLPPAEVEERHRQAREDQRARSARYAQGFR